MQNHTRLAGFSVITALAALLSAGCGDGGANCIDVVVTILSPSDGAEIAQAGGGDVEIDVTVRVDGLEAGDEVRLSVNGTEIATPATLNANREATFSSVVVPQAGVTLTVTAVNGCDDEGTDTVEIFVVGDLQCALAVANGTVDTDFYSQPVLNSSVDGDAGTPGFQATVEVQTAPGFRAELFVLDVDLGSEVSAGIENADATSGIATFDLTLAEGVQALRAQCVSAGGGTSGAAPTATFFVDTEAPTCAVTDPSDGADVIPDDDEDLVTDDTQITVTAAVTGGDTEGEAATFTVGTLDIDGTVVDSQGDTTATATFSSPGTKPIAIAGQDHALNTCTDSIDIEYITDGCSISITAPIGTVTSDSDGGALGVQLDVVAAIDTACAGRTATTTCDDGGTDTLDVTVPSDGITTFPITGCVGTDNCTVSYSCSVQVSNGAGIMTSESLTVSIDNEGPGATTRVTGIGGTISCGGAAGDLDDLEAGTPGVQVDVRVISAVTAIRSLTHNGSPVTLVGDTARVTLADGSNAFIGQACDVLGNCDTDPCNVDLAALPVNFNAPFVTDAVLGPDHGTGGPGGLTVDICGTVGSAGASVAITITPAVTGGDGPAVVAGTDWCRNGVTLPAPGPYMIRADATAGPDVGMALVSNITIDLTPPGGPTGEVVSAIDREAAQLAWVAPSDGGAAVASYLIRYDVVPITAGNFDAAINVAAPVPASPGTPQSAIQAQLNAGETYYFAIVSVDAVGNRSAVASDGPIVLDFTSGGVIPAPSGAATAQFFGWSFAGGDVDDDGLDDLIVGTPFDAGFDGVVHVFLGTGSGIGSSPDFTFAGMEPGTQFGNSVVVLDWNDDGVDDIAVGAPAQISSAGRVSVFYGGALFDPAVHPTARSQTEASVHIESSGEGFLSGGFFGNAIAAADFNGDSRDDLVIGVPLGQADKGAVIVLLGGSAATTITVDDDDSTGLAGAKAWQILLGPGPNDCLFGNFVYALGRLDGATDTLDDIGIAGFVNRAACIGDHTAFIIHGRAGDPPGDLASLVFDPAQDLFVHGPDQVTTSFGNKMSSIETMPGVRSLVIAAPDVTAAGEVYILPGDADNGVSMASIDVSTLATATLTSSSENRLGRGLANNAITAFPDVNDDGFEDLLIAGGVSTPTMFVWYGPTLPTGSTTAEATADHTVAGPAAFDTVTTLSWTGDLNADGLTDICWADIDDNAAFAGDLETLY